LYPDMTTYVWEQLDAFFFAFLFARTQESD